MLWHSVRAVGNGAITIGLLVACGDDDTGVGAHMGSPDPPASDGGTATPASESEVSDSGASDGDMARDSDTSASDGDTSDAGPSDDGPTVEDDQSATADVPSLLDASVDDLTSEGPDEPDSGSLPRGLGTDELADALQRYWLVGAQIGGCGDLFRYERFAAQPSFSRLVYSTPGCFGAHPDGGSEYPGTYQLSGRRLSVIQTDIALEEQYDVAIEQTALGLVQHPGIYLRQTEFAWTRQAARERRDDEGALQWRIASSVTVDFGATLPLPEGEACSVSLSVQLGFEGLEPEGEFLFDFGPYTCSRQSTAPGLVVTLPVPAAEELSMLDPLASDTVREIWPTHLRLPRPSAEYLLPRVGYLEIAESDVQR